MYPYMPQQATQDPINFPQYPPPGAQPLGFQNEPQRYAAPHPNMYPIPPPPMTNFPTQPLPLEAYQHQPLPPGARFISPPRYPTVDELRYKCSICGRFRSPQYHYRHPIPPGELPKPTVCRRCRDEATDSDDSDDYANRKIPRARSRSASRIVRPRSLSRGRSDLRRRYARSRSSSRETRRIHLLDDRRPPRRRSPSVEIVRVVEDDRHDRRSGSSYEDDLYLVDDDEYDCPPRTRMVSRAATSWPRMEHRQSSDPYLTERREYFDGPTSIIEERSLGRPRRQVSRDIARNVRVIDVPLRRPRIQREESQSEEDHYTRAAPRRPVLEEEDWYASRRRGRSRSRHERSRSRLSTYDDRDDHPFRHISVPRAPSPPHVFPRPHHEQVALTHARQPEALDRCGRHGTVARRARSHSRSTIEQPAETFLRPGDKITVIERSDYNAYEQDGMKVRVHEV